MLQLTLVCPSSLCQTPAVIKAEASPVTECVTFKAFTNVCFKNIIQAFSFVL